MSRYLTLLFMVSFLAAGLPVVHAETSPTPEPAATDDGETPPEESLAEERHRKPMQIPYTIKVTLVKIDRYDDVRKVRDLLKDVEGVGGIYPEMETQGLVELAVEAAPESAKKIFAILKDGFSRGFDVTLKNLPDKRWEINITKS